MLRMIIIVFFVFLAGSCTKQIDIDVPIHGVKPVINSFFTTDSLIKVHLSMTANIDEKIVNMSYLNNVIFYENNNKIEPDISIEDSLLLISFNPKAWNTYSIEILTVSGQKIVASDIIPGKSQFHVTGFKPKIGFDSEGYEFSEITIEVNDTDTNSNFYELCAVSNNNLDLVRNYVWSNDVIITNEGDADFYYYNLLFSDYLFNGHKASIKCYTWYDDSDKEIYIYLRSISLNYYKYKKSLMRHFANQEGDIWTGSGNPVNVYSNVEGGYGIFAGYQEEIDTIIINE